MTSSSTSVLLKPDYITYVPLIQNRTIFLKITRPCVFDSKSFKETIYSYSYEGLNFSPPYEIEEKVFFTVFGEYYTFVAFEKTKKKLYNNRVIYKAYFRHSNEDILEYIEFNVFLEFKKVKQQEYKELFDQIQSGWRKTFCCF